jgi:hypothetical protein
LTVAGQVVPDFQGGLVVMDVNANSIVKLDGISGSDILHVLRRMGSAYGQILRRMGRADGGMEILACILTVQSIES